MDRLCGRPSPERKPWKTSQCTEASGTFDAYAKDHDQCECATPFPKQLHETEPESGSAICDATCDTYSRILYRMDAVCFRYPFQKLYDDPECRTLEEQLFSLDREHVLDCRCHSFGNDKPLPKELCEQACVRFRKAANRYARLCYGNDHHFVQKYNTEECLKAAGEFYYEQRVTAPCGCAGEGAPYPTPKGPRQDTKECRTLCEAAGTLNNILYRSCLAITFDKKNYEKPECYDMEERFFFEYPWKDLERCGCRFWPSVPSSEADGAPPPGYPLDHWRGEPKLVPGASEVF